MLVWRSKYDALMYAAHGQNVRIAQLETQLEMREERYAIKEDIIASLKRRVKELVEEAKRERQRADNAVDALLERVVAVHPITPPEKPDTAFMDKLMKDADEVHDEDEDEVKRIIQRMEQGDESVMEEAGSNLD